MQEDNVIGCLVVLPLIAKSYKRDINKQLFNKFKVLSAQRHCNKKALQKEAFSEKLEKEGLLAPMLKFGGPMFLLLIGLLLINLLGPFDDYEVSGVRQGKKVIFMAIYNAIGMIGINLIGVLGISFFGFLLSKRILNPTNELVYEK